MGTEPVPIALSLDACEPQLTRGAQLTFIVRKYDFDPAILRSSTLCGVYIHWVFVTITLDLDALFVDPQINQHVGHCLCTRK